MIAVLNEDHETVEQAAQACLDLALEILEERSKFAVVGQLSDTKERGDIDPSDPEAIKLMLGLYSTEGDARTAAASLWHSSASGDTYRCWVLNVHHGTAADLHAAQRAKYVELEAKQKEKEKERVQAQIQKRMDEAEARNGGGKGACQCGHIKAEHRMDGSSTGACFLPDCSCPKWSEKNK